MPFKFTHKTSGYCDCACRDCFDTAISSAGDSIGTVLCWACKQAGCEAQTKECERPGAYESEQQEESHG